MVGLFHRLRTLFSPANIALMLSVLVTCLWVIWGVSEMVIWGVSEMFHEGWYAPFEWLFFLLPASAMLTLTLIGLRWPRVGAALFVAIGVGFGGLILWQYRPGGGRSAGWTLVGLLSWVPVTGRPAQLGAGDTLPGGHRPALLPRTRTAPTTSPLPGRPRPPIAVGGGLGRGAGLPGRPPGGRGQRRRRTHYLAAVGVPLLLGAALAVGPAYRVAHRVDDGPTGSPTGWTTATGASASSRVTPSLCTGLLPARVGTAMGASPGTRSRRHLERGRPVRQGGRRLRGEAVWHRRPVRWLWRLGGSLCH